MQGRLRSWAKVEESGFSERRLHLSLALFIGGVALLVACAGIVIAAQAYPATFELSQRYVLRQLGGTTGGIGAILMFLGLLAALYTRRYMRIAGVAGGAVASAGVVGFAFAYPFHWGVPGVPDWSVPVGATLVSGIALLLSATFSALVSNMVLRSRVRAGLRDELGREPTDEEVNRDIDEAIRRHRYTWGGIVKDDYRGLRIAESIPPEWQAMGWKLGRDEEAPATDVDASTRMLEAFRGGRVRTGELDASRVNDNADALVRLRRAAAEAEAARPWNRFKAWLLRAFRWLFHRGVPQ